MFQPVSKNLEDMKTPIEICSIGKQICKKPMQYKLEWKNMQDKVDTKGKEYLGLGQAKPKLGSEWLVVLCGDNRYMQFMVGETIFKVIRKK